MKPGTKRLLGAGAALLPLGGVMALTEGIMRFAVDRELPAYYTRKDQKLDPYAFLEPKREKLRNTPHETVEVRSHDGLRLVGHWFSCPDARRVILAAHGWRSRWYNDFCGVANFWRENQCSVLFIEQRAQGESEGRYMTYGILERRDCVAWLEWICGHCGREIPIYLAGISMGAATVLMASELALPGNVRGIMADCGFTSPDAIWRHVGRHGMRLPYVFMSVAAAILFYLRTGCSSYFSAEDALRKCTLPVLFIHGEADDFVPKEMTLANFAACASPKKLLIIPKAGHGLSYLQDREAYERMERQFWRDNDGAD